MKHSLGELHGERARMAALAIAAAGIVAVSACAANTSSDATPFTATPSVVSTPDITPSSSSNVHRSEALEASGNPQLAKIAQYESLSGAGSVERASFFVPTPATTEQAAAYAADTVATLQDFAKAAMPPLVFIEPANDSGNLDLRKYAAGGYDAALNMYFSTLKAQGVTDPAMGTWVILPEGNLPEWSSVDPSVYAKTVVRTAKIQKQYFPGSNAAIMLDSETYPTATSYNDGAYVSLEPYVKDIPQGLIDSMGLQGFPEPGVANPSQYLRTDLLAEAAHKLGVHEVWLNTGTFSEKYDTDQNRMISTASIARSLQLDQVAAKANVLRQQGFKVAVHLFAENKLQSNEKTDWSYWHSSPDDGSDAKVFTSFSKRLERDQVALWVYDAPEN